MMRFLKIMLSFSGIAFCSLLHAADSVTCSATMPPDRPAMELGGFLTADFLSSLDDFSGSTLTIGEVDLGAKVNISEEVVASVVVKSWNKLDSLWIDQALASFRPSRTPIEILFGQQILSFGLLTTRLISFPLIYDDVDLRRPSFVINASKGAVSGALGLTFIEKSDGLDAEKRRLYSAIVTIDAQLPNESIARLSSCINKDEAGIDLAGAANAGPFSIDAEFLTTVKSGSGTSRPSGFYAGVLWNLSKNLGVAVRGDGRSEDNFNALDNRCAIGFSYKIKDGIYGAFEIARSFPHQAAPLNRIAFELGLQQKIELPGFQRKTLGRK
jgi:hypothetical protein